MAKVWKTYFKDNANAVKSFFDNKIGPDGALSLLQGAGQIAGISSNAAQIQDTPDFDEALANVRSGGTHGYATYDQVLSEMQNNYVPKQTFENVRGMDDSQRLGTLGSGALAGASAGAFLGLPGIIGGGILGAIGSAIGLGAGDEEARLKVAQDNYDISIAEGERQKRYASALESISNQNAIQGQVRAVAMGGNIKRQVSMQEFANKVLYKKEYPDRPVRQKCNGGVMVRVKVK